jgi:hypothetical protein
VNRIGYSSKLLRELWAFAKQRKIYWLLPIVLVGLIIALMVTAAHVSAPFIYTLF